jgi:hypothetical protein
MDFETPDTVIDLGNFGPDIDLTINGFGTFVVGGAVPEPSTWALLLFGFAGLGFAGYRSAGRGRRLHGAQEPHLSLRHLPNSLWRKY